MKTSQLLGERFRDRAFEIASQNLMTRGGYMKQVGNGIYSLFPPAKRIVRKIERILREEMDRIGGQEVLFPVTMPASLWEQSGRYTGVGSELVRFCDRSGAPMVLGMTHEEAAVHLSMHVAGTYRQYPFMIYQIQTKFRDEPRARGGLIRVREFTMKDGYSFHTSQEDLEAYYERCHRAYERIFARAGLSDVISVLSDSGMMGGKVSHEFMLLADIGEDTLVLCDACGYRANIEAAECITSNAAEEAPLLEGGVGAADGGRLPPALRATSLEEGGNPLTLVDTGENKTIEEVCAFLGVEPHKTCKAVVYQRNADDSFVVVFCRGDIEISETKLRNHLKAEIHPAQDLGDCGLVAGCCGPVGLSAKADVLFDQSLVGATNLVCGANKEGYHYTGFTPARELSIVNCQSSIVNVGQAFSGGPCPSCGQPITISHGIEVGNIFQLGARYTESMDMTFDDAAGDRVHPIMGCYGIGVGRLMASVCEAKHDDYGPFWPITIAPWQVQICALRVDDPEVREQADKLYGELQKQGIEVLFDDRPVSPGFMFSDADLLGVPIRLIISPKTLARGAVELVTRDKSIREDVPVADILPRVQALIAQLTAEIEERVPESL